MPARLPSDGHDGISPRFSSDGELTRLRWTIVVAIAIVAGSFACWRWGGTQSPAVSDSNRNSHIAELIAAVELDDGPPDRPGYLGWEACSACHAERVKEFQASRHFLACCLPSARPLAPAFDARGAAYATRDPELHFDMRHSGDDFTMTAVHATPQGDERTTSRIDLVYGAGGTTDEVYFTWHDDRLFELPVVWLHSRKEWGASVFDPHAGGDYSRATTPQCLECHNTWFQHVPGTANEYRRAGCVLGVTCERCHGPGSEHVAFHAANPNSRRAAAIVHPGRLPRKRKMDLCAQCHDNSITHRAPPFSYRPGEELEAYFKVLTTRHPEDDHVANQVQYLRDSQCYQRSETLVCTTCHDPHRPRDAASGDSGRRACEKCHASTDCGERDRLPAAVQGDCIGCHMPLRNKIQVNFRTENDAFVPPAQRYEHRIAAYPEARDEVLLEWHRSQTDDASRREADRLAASLAEFWLSKSRRLQQSFRYLAAIEASRQALRFEPSQANRDRLQNLIDIHAKLDADWFEAAFASQNGRTPEAIGILHGILKVKPDLARAHGKLGTLYALVGQREKAVEHLEAVAKCDPDDLYGHTMLGWLAYLDRKPEDALRHYKRALEIDPYRAKLNFQNGLALRQLDRADDATNAFRTALKIDPRYADACHALGEALRWEKPAEALQWALRAVRLTQRKNPHFLLTLAEICADARRFDDAEGAARMALDAAPPGDEQLAAEIRSRLATVQAASKKPAPR
jgi:tetratricopeptide (TPR) repeat protein